MPVHRRCALPDAQSRLTKAHLIAGLQSFRSEWEAAGRWFRESCHPKAEWPRVAAHAPRGSAGPISSRCAPVYSPAHQCSARACARRSGSRYPSFLRASPPPAAATMSATLTRRRFGAERSHELFGALAAHPRTHLRQLAPRPPSSLADRVSFLPAHPPQRLAAEPLQSEPREIVVARPLDAARILILAAVLRTLPA